MTKKKRNPLLYKNRKSAKLATEALKQTFKAKPSKGYKYLYKLKNGSVFQTQSKTKGILIECDGNARVIIIEVPSVPKEDANYYLGKQIIGAKTEVKEIR